LPGRTPLSIIDAVALGVWAQHDTGGVPAFVDLLEREIAARA
jgi:hypothetical protein